VDGTKDLKRMEGGNEGNSTPKKKRKNPSRKELNSDLGGAQGGTLGN